MKSRPLMHAPLKNKIKNLFKKTLLTAPFCAALFVGSLAGAQNMLPNLDRYGSGYFLDPEGVPYSSKYYPVQPSYNLISLVRAPELNEDQFILRISAPFVKSGCAEISDYGYMSEYRDIYLDIAVYASIVDLRDQSTYGHFECDLKAQQPVANIIINRDDILKNRTQEIRLHNGTDTNYYNITLTDNRVLVLPDRGNSYVTRKFRPHNIPQKFTSLSYWFYPVGTLLLWSPDIEREKDAADIIASFARENDLTPLAELYPSFKSPLKDKRYFYYVDSAGKFTKDKATLENPQNIGELTVNKTVFGLKEDRLEADTVKIYAKSPGEYD